MKKKVISTVVVLFIAVLGFLFYNNYANSQTVKGSKNITVEVISTENNMDKTFTHSTDAAFLGQALDEMKLIGTEKQKTGRFVTEVNKIKTDTAKQQWWQYKVNDQDATTGIDETPVKDGDKIVFTLKTGW